MGASIQSKNAIIVIAQAAEKTPRRNPNPDLGIKGRFPHGNSKKSGTKTD